MTKQGTGIEGTGRRVHLGTGYGRMLCFPMAFSTQQELLERIRGVADELVQQRGEHAAGLWSVSDFISGLGTCLVPFEDEVMCDDAHLAVLADGENWGLYICRGDEHVPACKAPPALAVAAVRRMPEFLAAYLERLQSATGSKMTRSLASQYVEVTAEISSPTPASKSRPPAHQES